ncbi:MAG: 5'-nucleotidase C-terminal domain-containing protein [Flavobacteriales bacterium]|jgi:2',3'-cyclic-nucleotide 2'-phosphodiesterase (5'-nucleotidase family)|nr:5'-nucleotidase C-terminal domain-containing protein [Flavobacteriales bacterium]
MRWLWFAIFLSACSGSITEYKAVEMNDSISDDGLSESMIAPYRDSLELTMNSVLVQNQVTLTRGIPESTLGNLIADLLLERAQTELPDSILPDLCLINIGGLRVDLPEGDITIGKVFELMPFENELDVLELSPERMKEMLTYLKEVGGQPFSGMNLTIKPNGYDCEINGEPLDENRTYYIVTSDYLADGGDKMYFFKEPLTRIKTGIKLRDAIINHFRIVGLAGKPLTSSIDGRLTIE